MEVFLGLGSNLGDRSARLAAAVASLRRLDAGLEVSPVYETEPVGGPPGQADHCNLVVACEPALGPHALLELCRRLEAEAGRLRTVPLGPRTLDVDVLLVGDLVLHEPDLVVPHPRLRERRFALAPLADLAPELVPGWLLAAAGGAVRRLGMLETLDPIS